MAQTEELLVELATILARDDNSDISQLDACLDALDREDPLNLAVEPEASLSRFKKTHAELIATAQTEITPTRRVQVSNPFRPPRRWQQFAAVMAATFLLSTCIAQAGVWRNLAIWTKDIFSFGVPPLESSRPSVEPERPDVLAPFSHDRVALPLAPLPGYTPSNTYSEFTKNSSLAYSLYESEATGKEYLISVRQFESADLAQTCLLEKTEAGVDIYTVSGIDHYLMENTSTITATWVNGPYLCTISGTVSSEDLKAIIDSAYI